MNEPLCRLPEVSRPPLRDARTLALIALLLVVAFVRFVNLSADPPLQLTTSQGVYTDPAAYTLSARNTETFGVSNPLHDDRFPLFENSAVSFVARFVFGLFGVGYAQANAVGLLFSLGTILLIVVLLRRFVSTEAAIFTLALLLFNQNQYHYGRLSFLENAMVFLGVLSFFTLTLLERRTWGAALAGFILPAAFLYGKSHGVVFVGVTGLYFLWNLLSMRGSKKGGTSPVEYLRLVIAPFGVATLVHLALWYALIGVDAAPTIRSYVAEQSTGLYGAPEAFDSVLSFFWKLFSLGVVTKIFSRMPVASLGALVMIGLSVWRLIGGRGKRDSYVSTTGLAVFFALWFVLTYAELFIWNYRPLRYQIPLTYSACALGGIWLAGLWRGSESLAERFAEARMPGVSRQIWAFVVLAFLFMFAVYERLSRTTINSEGVFHFSDHIYWVVGGGAALAALTYAGMRILRKFAHATLRPTLIRGFVIALPAISLGSGIVWFKDWVNRPLYTIVATSRDLPKVIGRDAVISGPYGVGLSYENHLKAIVHMFGVADPDTSFFERFPVTHLLLDESNRTRFEQLHPEIAYQSRTIHVYRITNRKVELVRVAGVTGNPQADSYHLSDFEKAQLVFDGELPDPGGKIIRSLMYSEKVNLAINLYMSVRAEQMGNLADAAFFITAALEASPTDFNLWAELGRVFTELYEESHLQEHRQKARQAFSRAHELNPASVDKTGEFEARLEQSGGE